MCRQERRGCFPIRRTLRAHTVADVAMNRARQVANVAAFALTACLALGLAGCKSSGSGSGGGTTAGGAVTSTPTTSTTKAAPTSAPAQGKLDGVPAACPSADEVMSNLHLSSLTVSGDDPSTCQYLFNGSKSAIYVIVTFNAAPGVTAAAIESGLKTGQSDVEPVSGLADAAFSFKGPAAGEALTFLSGTTICSIATSVSTTTADEVTLAKAILQG
jgi:hypothetical protein